MGSKKIAMRFWKSLVNTSKSELSCWLVVEMMSVLIVNEFYSIET